MTEDNRRAIAFDSTMFDALQRCPRMFLHQYVQNLRLIDDKPYPLHKGVLIHHFAERFNDYRLEHPSKHPIMLWQAIEREFTLDLLKELKLYSLTPEDFYWCKECFRECMEKEVHYYITGKAETNEAKVIFEDENYVFFWTGKIDVRVSGPGFEDIPLDYKSESRRFTPDKKANQFMGYAWLTDSTDLAIQKVSLQETKKYRTHPFYHLSWMQEEIDDWVENTIGVIKQYVFYRDIKWFPQHRPNCMAFGRPCSFTRICEAGGSKQEIASANYVVGEPWSILRGREK